MPKSSSAEPGTHIIDQLLSHSHIHTYLMTLHYKLNYKKSALSVPTCQNFLLCIMMANRKGIEIGRLQGIYLLGKLRSDKGTRWLSG